MSAHPRTPDNDRVLVSGHLPPPMGGIAMFYQSLLGSSLPQKVNLQFVQTSSQKRDLADAGKASLSNLMSAVQDCLRFFRAARQHKPHIAHIATAPGFSFLKHSLCVLYASFSGSKVLIHPHCSIKALYSEKSKPWQWYVRLILRRANGLIALSEEWKQITQAVPGIKVYLLPNGINQTDYKQIASERFRQPLPLRKKVLYLGYLGKAKGSYELIEAARLVLRQRSDVEFHLVGGELAAGERDSLQQLVERADIAGAVQIHQPVGYEEKLEHYRQADIFVYPSYYEGMPMAVIEAMASGLPVIASQVGGLPDLVEDHKNGLLIPPKSPSDLNAALNELLDDADLCRAMQQHSSRLAAEKYDIEKLVDELVGIYVEHLPRRPQKLQLETILNSSIDSREAERILTYEAREIPDTGGGPSRHNPNGHHPREH